jgi:hypothetical protein
MFNLKSHKTAESVAPYEKYLRNETIGPKADDSQPITEKSVQHRTGNQYTTTEDQLKEVHSKAKTDAQVIEEVLNSATSTYVNHRSAQDGLLVPPINTLVEKMRQERLSSDFKQTKDKNWTVTFNDKKQNGSLPKWPKITKQHEKTVLNNDSDRFKNKEPEALIGDLTVADIDRAVVNVKNGVSAEFDTAIVAILEKANQDNRQLTNVEQMTISDLKIARTKAMVKVG